MDEQIEKNPTSNEDWSFLDLLIVLARHRKLMVLLPLAAAVVSIITVLLLPEWYTATTKIMPPQQSQSNTLGMLGQLNLLSGSGANQALGLKNPSDIYVAVLKSRSIADKLITKFDLKSVYNEELFYYLRRKLAKYSSITVGREGVITIEVDDKDPDRAASIANGYVEELRNLTLGLAFSEASQRRAFFEEQLKKAKADLGRAEIDLQQFAEKAGLVNPEGQVSLTMSTAAALQAQIAAKQVQLTAMRSFATQANPDVSRVGQELTGLKAELAKMERNISPGKGDVLLPVGKAPEVSLEYMRKHRDVKYFEALFEALAKQYEVARVDEAKEATFIQVLDIATAPDRKSWPPRMLIVVLSIASGLILAVLYALVRENFNRVIRDQAQLNRARTLQKLLFNRPL